MEFENRWVTATAVLMLVVAGFVSPPVAATAHVDGDVRQYETRCGDLMTEREAAWVLWQSQRDEHLRLLNEKAEMMNLEDAPDDLSVIAWVGERSRAAGEAYDGDIAETKAEMDATFAELTELDRRIGECRSAVIAEALAGDDAPPGGGEGVVAGAAAPAEDGPSFALYGYVEDGAQVPAPVREPSELLLDGLFDRLDERGAENAALFELFRNDPPAFAQRLLDHVAALANDPLAILDLAASIGIPEYDLLRNVLAVSQAWLAENYYGAGQIVADLGEEAVVGLLTLTGVGAVALGAKFLKRGARTASRLGRPPASAPVGRTGFPSENFEPPGRPAGTSKPRNPPGTVDGREYTGHAFDQMQNRGMVPSVVEDTIGRDTPIPEGEGVVRYVTEQAEVVVSKEGKVITTWPTGHQPRGLFEAALREAGLDPQKFRREF